MKIIIGAAALVVLTVIVGDIVIASSMNEPTSCSVK